MSVQFIEDFMRGQRDCQLDVPHKPGQPEAYDRGYAAEYESEQIMSEVSQREYRTA